MHGEDDVHTLVVGRDAMACRFEVVFNAGEVADDTARAVDALDLVDAIEDRITVYRDSSELARLNARAAEGWQPVGPELLALLVLARQLHERTGGAFDMAAGALVRAWGFLRRQGRTPTAEELARARESAGMRWVEIDERDARVRFLKDGVELNPGGIGKGWALDRMIETLRAASAPPAVRGSRRAAGAGRWGCGILCCPAGGWRRCGWRMRRSARADPGRSFSSTAADGSATFSIPARGCPRRGCCPRR